MFDLAKYFFFIHRLMVLLSNIEKSSEEIVEIMQGLSSIQVCFFLAYFIFLLSHLKKNRKETPV